MPSILVQPSAGCPNRRLPGPVLIVFPPTSKVDRTPGENVSTWFRPFRGPGRSSSVSLVNCVLVLVVVTSTRLDGTVDAHRTLPCCSQNIGPICEPMRPRRVAGDCGADLSLNPGTSSDGVKKRKGTMSP